MNSIRRRLLISLLAAISGVMVFAAWATFILARDAANELFDYHLKQVALSVRDQSFEASAADFVRDEHMDVVIRVWDLSGLSVYYSKPHEPLPEITRLGYSVAETREGVWRIFATQYHGMTIAVAQPMRVRDRLAANAAWQTLKPFFILLPLLAAAIWFIVGRGLRPLSRVTASLHERTPASLEPVSQGGVPEEVKPLVSAVNDLLARLKHAMAAQRDFVADAAHELRTPLTALRLQTQLLERASGEEAQKSALEELKAGLVRTSHTLEQMLTLARHEPGAHSEHFVAFDLLALARQSVIDHMRIAEARKIDLGVIGESPILLVGEPDAIRILLSNLIVNALRYAPIAGHVDVSCCLEGDCPVLEVDDNGPGIPEAERSRVIDRFYRRAGDSGAGSGLGLPIVRAIAERHGARLILGEGKAKGLSAKVIFPSTSLASK